MIAALVVHWQKSLRKSVDHLDLRTRWKREKEENGAIRARRQVFCSRLSCVVDLMKVGDGAVAQPGRTDVQWSNSQLTRAWIRAAQPMLCIPLLDHERQFKLSN